MARGKKSVDSDKLTDVNLQRVILLLNPAEEGKKPITKKEACNILGITYNVTRLQTLIDTYKERVERDKAKRAEKRGKPAKPEEISYAINEYLSGSDITSIAKSLYRSTQFVKHILEAHSVPIRQSSHNYFTPELIPEGAVKTKFNIGEKVYSARYDSTAVIESEATHPTFGYIYKVWLLSDSWKQFAYQPACELASLEHLKELGVSV